MVLLGCLTRDRMVFAYRAVTSYGVPFQYTSANQRFCNSVLKPALQPSDPTTPPMQRRRAWHIDGLGCSPFARRYLGSRCCFPFLRVTEMFHFTRFPLPTLYIQAGVTPRYGCRVSPFGHPRINAHSTASRGLSQPVTSFIGSRCQGIHRWPFVA